MNEIWKPVVGFEGLYEVSDLGNVRSLNYRYTGRVQNIIQTPNEKVYLYVSLGRKTTRQVHRLVAMAFITNPHNLPCINHIDENPSNNRVDNLEWCSHKYNNSYGKHCDKILEARRKNKKWNAEIPVIQLTLDGVFVAEYKSLMDASRATGIGPSNIGKC